MKNSIMHGIPLFLLISLFLSLFCGITVLGASTSADTIAAQATEAASDILIESTEEWLHNRASRSTASGAYTVSTLHQLPCQYSDEAGEQQNMSYIIMTAKGKIIVIDGGYRISDPEYLLAYLKKITGKDKPNVDAWFLTHAHADHVGAFRAIASKYSDQITVEAVYHRLPTEAEIDQYFYNDDPAGLKTKVQQVHSACALLKTKSGATTPMRSCTPAYKNGTYSSFTFDDVYIEILMTCKEVFWFHDNCADESYSGTWDNNNYSFSSKTYPYLVSCDFNNSSMVFRAHIGGKSILFMGDTCHASGIALAKCHDRYLKDGTRFSLKSDIVQVAHHGIGKFPKDVYTRIDPDVCLWPTYATAYDGPAETKHSAYHTRQWLKKSVNILSYQGPQVLSFGADRLLFDFKTDATSISRYYNSVYGMHNFASASYWNKGPDMAKASISGGKLLLTTAATSTGKPNEYIETTTAKASGRTHPLLFTPSANNVVIIAYQVTKYDQSTNYSKWGNGQKPTISLYAFDNGTETYENASQVTVDTSGKYVVQKWALPQAWLQYKITNLHLKIRYFLNSSISIDYIYIGPETHAYQETVTAPSCTAEGSIAYNCTFCGHSYKEVLSPTGHKEVINTSVAPTCTETGLTEGKHCSVCNAVLVAQQTVPATGHADTSPKDNRCDVCACRILPAALFSRTISLKGNIAVNYYMDLDDSVAQDENAYMLFTLESGEQIKVPAKEGVKTPYRNSEYYVFSCAMPAKEMADMITCQFFYGEGETEVYTYSIKTYADRILASNAKESLRNLICAMLNYGAASQIHFEYHTDRLANEGLEVPDYSAVSIDGFPINKDQGTALAKYAGASLLLTSETTLRIFFKVDASVENFTASYKGQNLPLGQRLGMYYADITDISAKDLDEYFTLVISDGKETAEVSYAPLCYCASILVNANGLYDRELQDCMAAMYLYNQAANVYFAN